LSEAILTLAENLKATAVDAILAKRDLELGFEVLTGRSPLFRRSHHGDRNRRGVRGACLAARCSFRSPAPYTLVLRPILPLLLCVATLFLVAHRL
jgi:hypothetical protein